MKTIDRRKWLRTVGLSGGFAMLGGLEALALETPSIPDLKNKIAKLSSNENPYGPSKRVRQAITNTFDSACRYPFAVLGELVQMIAEKEGVSKDHIVVTGGSGEGLCTAGLIYGMSGGEIVAADPTFQQILRYAEVHGSFVHRVPVDENMNHDLDAMEKRITSKTSLVYICNPNNPTGTIIEKNKLKDFCSSVSERAVVFSDEAYYDFITEPDYPSMVELVKEGSNVIVSKTFSKVYGMAGLRIGYLVTRPDIARRLKSSVMARTNILAIAAAKEALKDDEFYKFSIQKSSEGKQIIYNSLDNLGLEYIKSHTNFVFFKSGRHIDELIKDMKKENVAIGRPFPPFYDWARISTGRIEEVEQFGKALKKVMA
ncbi:histidinol-phosphate aminotransferase family protein [Maribacter algarum]|uniref:Histidinol-phosphate aminotransferase family protein n=1 Tax=Maribacter algarum (ex Zhang et al. 2020) TaxID=2578118 RepID=A0A5S3QHV3_9FLAO|nr:histidinol-phosphate transaminase [Maribacter algarum]TMM57115.1 histidinol-phosphate aminotransferase family protein [Maribacter algarum]